ncbi:MAG: ADP-ribosylglycohydrolase family protein [Armatimonadetes bacterium]|nr:ADP-ribosylglycohydrolase family protein [Armatimonadota bacterium]
MKHIWLYLNKSDIETERLQCEQEGLDLSSVEEDFERVLQLDLENLSNQPQAQALLDKTVQLPIKAGYAFVEPSDLEGIRAQRPAARPQLPSLSLTPGELEDKVHGAWTGRATGCLLGKPVEGWRRPRMYGYLKDLNKFPLEDFFRYNVASEIQEKYKLTTTQTTPQQD